VAEITLAAFFSYSREDSEFALRLAGDLKAAGANVWLDQLDITPGQRWDNAVEDALKNCPRLIVVLSPAAVKSQNVMDEVSFALEERKTVIPVIHRDCDVPFRLRRVQHADFRQDYERSLQELIKTLVPGQGVGQGTAVVPELRSGSQSGVADAPQRTAEQPQIEERRKPAEKSEHPASETLPISHLLGPVLIDTASIAALWTVISVVASYLSDQFQHAPYSRAAIANWTIWLIEQYLAGLIVVTVLRRFRPTFRRIHLALFALVWPVVYVVTLTMIRWLGEGGPLAVGEALVGAVGGLILSMDLEGRPWMGALVGAVSFGLGQVVARLILNSVQAGMAVELRYIVHTVHFFTLGILEAGPLVWYLHFRDNQKVER
jgi:hypothetical protein